MRLKLSLVFLTLVSVVADTMVLPFYPQFFSQVFGVDSASHVGLYIAACCFTVMMAFPVWAKVAQRVNELHLWVYTQVMAGVLGLYCFYTTNLIEFWIASQLMLVFKASYLLIYPFVLRLEERDKHLGVVSLFSVLMHFGGIGGALLGGATLQWFDPRYLYLIMPATDALQVVVCLYLIYRLRVSWKDTPHNVSVSIENEDRAGSVTVEPTIAAAKSDAAAGDLSPVASRRGSFVWKLGVASLLFYFSAFLIRPFFTRYWETVSQWQSDIVTALVYSIPAWIALLCLWWEKHRASSDSHVQIIVRAAVLAFVGLLVQGTEVSWMVVLGRCLFGYAMFQITVRMEVFLFESSEPKLYASDFSRIHIFQNVGVIGASFSVGYLVTQGSYVVPFYAAAAGFLVSLACFYGLFKEPKLPASAERDERGERDSAPINHTQASLGDSL